ncbi:hypothetical protein CLV88_101503 [Shimia abyssi]|uniref:Uncharacterized protein n=1 Tax=Shimia abyssi TaxID=1662395 RepID=A0A2P8FK59_9RHOB|nr:hypothetical protein CLV88_101503 [Shimia abyssi]
MRRGSWHIKSEGQTLTLSRGLRARLDVAASTSLPDAGRTKIAHQVRQDLWRALQGLKGFSPVIKVRREAGQLHVIAGGEVSGHIARDHVECVIQGVLDNPEKRTRWLNYARHKSSKLADRT